MTAGKQPYLHDLVIALRAPAMAMSGTDGQVDGSGAEGFYVADRRVLSRFLVTVDGVPPAPVLGASIGADGARFLGVVRELGDTGPDPTVFVDRYRQVASDRIREQITVRNSARVSVRATISVELGSDLADIADVKSGAIIPPLDGEFAASGARWQASDGTVVAATVSPVAETADASGRLHWAINLPPGQSWSLALDVHLDHDPIPRVVLPAPADCPLVAPSVRSGDHRLAALVARSVADLRGLLTTDPLAPEDHMLTAGVPWFLTLFGRDSIWAARMLLPLGTDIAAGTLRALARRQGNKDDVATGEQPGKILHEIRRAGVDHRSETQWQLPPLYYGTVDATPLWISLLHDAWRWGMPTDQVEALLPALDAALGWLRDSALGTDGFVSYVDESGRGLANQGWKDSADSVQFRDGTLAKPPIALCEVQGYAHLAAQQGATMLDAFGRPGGDWWRDWAQRLADRFRAQFWVDDHAGAFPAIALDGVSQRVDTVTSNIAHLLGTGLLNESETAHVVARLAAPELDCGFGLRTMSADSRGFNPLSYHGGSVWTHDTAIAISGLASTRTPAAQAAAASLLSGLLDAAPAFDYRLPELFGGETARPDQPPLAYPAACRPQAWSAAAAIALLQSVLGISPDVPGGVLRLSPLQASPVGELTVRGLRVAGETLDVHLADNGTLEVLTAPATMKLDIGGDA